MKVFRTVSEGFTKIAERRYSLLPHRQYVQCRATAGNEDKGMQALGWEGNR